MGPAIARRAAPHSPPVAHGTGGRATASPSDRLLSLSSAAPPAPALHLAQRRGQEEGWRRAGPRALATAASPPLLSPSSATFLSFRSVTL